MNIRRIIWNNPFLSDKKRLEWYPAFWLMHIKVLELSPSWSKVRILLPHSWIATNTGGSMFGGFQACLADPIAAMSCVKIFPGFSIWTRSLHLDFQHQGLSNLELRFIFPPEQQAQIRQELKARGRSTPIFEYGYYQADGKLCTRIKAVIAIRSKGYKRPEIRK